MQTMNDEFLRLVSDFCFLLWLSSVFRPPSSALWSRSPLSAFQHVSFSAFPSSPPSSSSVFRLPSSAAHLPHLTALCVLATSRLCVKSAFRITVSTRTSSRSFGSFT